MVRGIGVDMVYIPEIERIMEQGNGGFIKRGFTGAEREQGERATQKAEYYAGLFAAKEAVFKAIGHLTKKKVFDYRYVETLHHEDGSPYINVNEFLRPYMEEAGVREILISITNERDYVTAFCVAQD